MIARNEASMIEGCLASVRGLVSEMIVVDTGSVDETREIARRAGARVFDVPWQDDFSHARNASLATATGDWILVLDADERLVNVDMARLEKALAQAKFDCALLRLHDASSLDAAPASIVSGEARLGEVQRVPRLLRRAPDLAYVGVIHEDVAPWIVRGKRKVGSVDLDIAHFGAVPEVYAGRKKLDRNVTLLEKLAADTPKDPTAHGYLAHQYLANAMYAEARDACERGWQRVAYLEATVGYRPSILRLTGARAQLQLMAGDLGGALETVRRAELLEGPHSDLDHIAGYALEQLASKELHPVFRMRLLDRARACFERCLRPRDEPEWQVFVAGARSWASSTRLGAVELQRENYEAAQRAFDGARGGKPARTEAALGFAEATIRRGSVQEALAVVRDLLTSEPLRATRDAWVLAAAACDLAGALDDMETFLAEAGRREHRYVDARRRVVHGELLAARALYRGTPVSGPGRLGTMAALIARLPLNAHLLGAYTSTLGSVRILVRNLLKVGRGALVEPLLEPRANVVMPGLTEHVVDAARELGAHLAYAPPSPVVLVSGEDRERVVRLLDSHPRLAGRARASDANEERSEAASAARRIETGLAAASDSAVRVVWAELLEDPATECDRLLAALGEADAEPLVRHLMAEYSPAA